MFLCEKLYPYGFLCVSLSLIVLLRERMWLSVFLCEILYLDGFRFERSYLSVFLCKRLYVCNYLWNIVSECFMWKLLSKWFCFVKYFVWVCCYVLLGVLLCERLRPFVFLFERLYTIVLLCERFQPFKRCSLLLNSSISLIYYFFEKKVNKNDVEILTIIFITFSTL